MVVAGSTTQPTADGIGPGAARADEAYGGKYLLIVPVALRIAPGGFEQLDHDGAAIARLDPLELCAAAAFCQPHAIDDGFLAHVIVHGDDALDKDRFVALCRRLDESGLIGRAGEDGEDTVEGKYIRDFRTALGQSMRRAVTVDAALAAQREQVAEEDARVGRRRVEVVPVTDGDVPLLSLGQVMSYAMVYDDGRLNESYAFIRDWMNRTVPSLTGDEPPAVFAFSNYLWSHQANLASSARVKASGARHVTVHGGPDSPKYEGDVEAYFQANPHIDVAVHGEGEVTFAEMLDALAPSLLAGEPDLSALAGVAGLSYRDGDRVVRTEARDRIADLDVVPSPYLNGLFDSVGTEGLPYIIIETNRGCPYGCTYCDWGSATLSRIRKFDLDRVFAELEWAALHGVKMIWNADANFGVFARDVDIARQIVDLKREHRYPELYGANYAKNTVKHLRQIVDTLVEGGILATGVLSMQSADEETLLTIRRQNIKVDRYDDLAEEFSRNELPVGDRAHDGAPGLDAHVARERPPAVHRPRDAGPHVPDRAAREQPDERPGVPRGAPDPDAAPDHRDVAAGGSGPADGAARGGDRDLHPRRLPPDGPLPPALLPLRELRRAASGVALRPPGDGSPRRWTSTAGSRRTPATRPGGRRCRSRSGRWATTCSRR